MFKMFDEWWRRPSRRYRPYAMHDRYDLYGSAPSVPQWEVLDGALYDSCALLKGIGIASAKFFQVPVGQGRGGDGGSKRWSDTNMLLPYCLPTGQAFLIKRIQVRVVGENVTPEIERQFFSRGSFRLDIGSKSYTDGAPIDQQSDRPHGKRFCWNFSDKAPTYFVDDLPTTPSFEKAFLRLEANMNFCLSLQDVPPLDVDARAFVHLFGDHYRQTA